MPTVRLGDRTVDVERVSALKASRAFAILKGISKQVPAITKQWGEYVTSYEREHYVELTRTQARLRFPPRPILDPDTRQPIRDDAGELVLQPGPVEHMTEADWQASGNVLRLPDSPTTPQIVAAVFEAALEVAEESVYRLLALFTIRNEDLYRAWRSGQYEETLEAAVETLMMAYGDELMELAAVAGELVDEQFRSKAEELGDRMGKALRLVGINPPERTSPNASTPSDSRPTSSTDGPASTDGAPATSSAPRSTSSPASPSALTPSEPELERSAVA